jgi:hypothetical protein
VAVSKATHHSFCLAALKQLTKLSIVKLTSPTNICRALDLPLKMAALQLALLLALSGNAIAVNNGLARTPQMGWVSQGPASCISGWIADLATRTIGTPWAATFPNPSSSTPPKSFLIRDYEMSDTIMWCWMTAGQMEEMIKDT